MAVFLIVPLRDTVVSGELEERIKKVIPDEQCRFMLPNNKACLVKYGGISLELRKKLNLTGTEGEDVPAQTGNIAKPNTDPIPAVIFHIQNGAYNGFGSADLWEWLSVNSK